MKMAHALERPGRPRFTCPVCGYHGVFVDAPGPTGPRKHGCCPQCGSFERHRLQAKALETIFASFAPETRSALHFAPEQGLTAALRPRFHSYKTADLTDPRVDYRCDLRSLPFDDGSVDFIFASHVLEHIAEDRLAIAEIHRILAPGGMAVLPVPIVCDATVEYPGPVATEDGHVRAPGPDYFDRYREIFDEVAVLTSADFGEDSQLFIYEDRTQVPNAVMPYRQPMVGVRHPDYVPVCLKSPCGSILVGDQARGAQARAAAHAAHLEPRAAAE
jgi:predicted SAM-dependent methyltransferase